MSRLPKLYIPHPFNPLATLPILFLTVALASCTVSSDNYRPNTPAITKDQALTLLKDGNQRYEKGHSAHRQPPLKRLDIVKKQKPFAVILACADSRTAPEVIFDQQLGNLFVCRVAGNVTDSAVLGSIEYAVEHLEAPLIVVLGHTKCGAVNAVLHPEPDEKYIEQLLSHVHVGSGLPAGDDEKWDAGVTNNTLHQVKSLTSQSSFLANSVKNKGLLIKGAVFSVTTGKVQWLD